MLRVIFLTLFQCFLLASGLVCFKLAVEKINSFQWTWNDFANLFTNWWLLVSGICLIAATLLWGFIMKHFEFSVAYPITAFAYVFGMLAAIFIFHETVPLTRWIGVGLIIAGVVFVVK
ncbi:MAG: EamA family transporter [Bacteroidales bacterium]|jgi:undecaprenyl phosphate-alpha-L-ara4N flippase subunit ArnE|nr:EamA family transporter [Bacteroidales bacterium]